MLHLFLQWRICFSINNNKVLNGLSNFQTRCVLVLMFRSVPFLLLIQLDHSSVFTVSLSVVHRQLISSKWNRDFRTDSPFISHQLIAGFSDLSVRNTCEGEKAQLPLTSWNADQLPCHTSEIESTVVLVWVYNCSQAINFLYCSFIYQPTILEENDV